MNDSSSNNHHQLWSPQGSPPGVTSTRTTTTTRPRVFAHRAATSTSTTTSSSSAWQSYKDWVRRHRSELLLWESFCDRLLWWYPTSSAPTSSSGNESTTSSWHYRRHILWSLAELQHLAIDLALNDDDDGDMNHDNDGMTLDTTMLLRMADNDGGGAAAFGTFSRGSSSSSSSSSSNFALTCCVALTVLHSLWPIVHDSLLLQQEQQQSTKTAGTSNRRQQHHLLHESYWQLQLERARFACRMAILISHWWRIRGGMLLVPSSSSSSLSSTRVVPGILQQGGLLPSLPRHTVQEEVQRVRRLSYIGRRTGRNVLLKNAERVSSSSSSLSLGLLLRLRMLLGEVLHIYRPLFWSQCKYRHYSSNATSDHNDNDNTRDLWKAWMVSLGLDVTSLMCLRQASCQKDGNPATVEEWKHRRLRLLLFLLRAPCSEQLTDPIMNRIQSWLAGSLPVPWLGGLLAAYLRDWLYYWKVNRLEE